jgi:hypothetical protein
MPDLAGVATAKGRSGDWKANVRSSPLLLFQSRITTLYYTIMHRVLEKKSFWKYTVYIL